MPNAAAANAGGRGRCKIIVRATSPIEPPHNQAKAVANNMRLGCRIVLAWNASSTQARMNHGTANGAATVKIVSNGDEAIISPAQPSDHCLLLRALFRV